MTTTTEAQWFPAPALTSPVLTAAVAALDAGLCPIPVAVDGTKRPDGTWKRWQTERPTRSEVEAWADQAPGFGIVTGTVSGHLEMIELEGRAVADGLDARFRARCIDDGLGEVLDRIVAGYSERTPSGGMHLLYRCPDGIEGNTRLARNTAGEVLIETRGEGGFVVVAPSGGPVHATGRPWELAAGSFATIATITATERTALHQAARTFDAPPTTTAGPGASAGTLPLDGGATPLTRFDQAHTSGEILVRNGFVHHHDDGQGSHYTRPGKDPRSGASATVWRDNGTATIWSTSVAAAGEALDGHRNLRPSQLAAHLEHGGNFSAVASAQVDAERGGRPAHEAVDMSWIDLGAPAHAGPDLLTGADDSPVDPSTVGWAPADIAAILAGEHSPLTPTIGRIDGSVCLFYAGKTNGLYGPPGHGKSFIAIHVAAEQMALGINVMFIDYEDTATTTVARLRALGVDDATIAARLTHISPNAPWSVGARQVLADVIAARAITFVVIDSTGEALAEDGVKPNEDDAVAQWFRTRPGWLTRQGCTVLVIDHVAKDRDARGSGPIGSQRKLAAITGASYVVEASVAPAKGTTGHLRLTCDKDRHGTWQARTIVANATVTSTPDGLTVAIDLGRHQRTDRPTALMERVSKYLETHGAEASQKTIEQGVTGKADYIRRAVLALVDDGYVAKTIKTGRGGGFLFTAVRTYRENPDDPFGDIELTTPDDGTSSPSSQPRPDPRDEDTDPRTSSTSSQPRPNLVPAPRDEEPATSSPSSRPSYEEGREGRGSDTTPRTKNTTPPPAPQHPPAPNLVPHHAPDVPTTPIEI